MISGGLAAGAFLGLAVIKMPIALTGVVALTTYACVRMLLPGSNREEDETKAASKAFIQSCRADTEAIRKAGKAVPPGRFQDAISKLVSVCNTLIQCFQQNPELKALLARMLEEDAVKLKSDARAYEELIDFDL